jgi:mannose-6-phosphate isomerase class I
MDIKKFRWSKVYESSEEELTGVLSQRNIHSTRIVAEAFSEQTQQASPQSTTIWCAEGSLSLRTESTVMSLQPGDAVRIGPEIACDLRAGISGYVCYVSS